MDHRHNDCERSDPGHLHRFDFLSLFWARAFCRLRQLCLPMCPRGGPVKFLVTGAVGFIGSHFVRYLLDHTDATVVCLDRIDSAGDLNRMPPSERAVFVHHDLRSEINWRVGDTLLTGRGMFDSKPFDHAIHMAAASHVDRSIVDPAGFVLDNVLGTANLFDFFRVRRSLAEGGRILYFSTDEVFGPADRPHPEIGSPLSSGFRSWSRFNPNNPYAASKAAAECLCTAYANTYALPILVTHCTNVFGEGQHREKFIPMVINQVRRGEMVKVHAQGQRPSSRFYTYVDNVSSAVMKILDQGRPLYGTDRQGKYNISGEREISNLEVAQKIADLMHRELRYELVDFVPERPKHDMRYAVDASALRQMGWTESVSFDDGLARVVRSET